MHKIFRIEFSDRSIQFNKLLQPLISELIGIPKLILAQFCRGDEFNGSACLDTTQLTTKVNSQG